MPATRWVLAIGFVVCLVGWTFAIRPLAPAWGDVATWVSGLATSGGLIFAGLQIRDARRQRVTEDQRRVESELEQREAMARAVSVSSILDHTKDGWIVKYTLANGGDYPIDNVVFVVADYVNDSRPEDQVGTAVEIVIGTMHHKQIIESTHPLHLTVHPPLSHHVWFRFVH